MFRNSFLTAWRNILKAKTLTLLNVSGLGIGVTVCLTIGVWLQRELNFDNFHPNGDRIYRVTNTFKSESESFSQAPSGPALGAQLPKLLPSVKSACRLFHDEYKLKVGNLQFFESSILSVDSNFFQFFGFRLKEGNPEQCLLSQESIVISERMAKKYFGNEDPMGKAIMLENKYPKLVSAVAYNPPPASHIQFDFLLPVSVKRNFILEHYKFDLDQEWVGGWPMTYVEIGDPAKRVEAERQINEVVRRYSEKDLKEYKMSYQYHLQPIGDIHLKSNLRYDAANNGSLARVRIFAIVGVIVLLLACINYVNLTTAGAIKRARETAVRKVIGALKAQLVRQFFLETVIICTIAVFLGLLMFQFLLPYFSTWSGTQYSFSLTYTNVGILAAFIILVSLISGFYPAFILSSFNPVATLKGSFIQSSKGNAIRKSLVVFQFTITIALTVSILTITQQMQFIRNKSLGYNAGAVMEIGFNGDRAVLENYEALRNELMKNPYILNVSKHGQSLVGGLGNGWTTTENLKGDEISTSLYNIGVDTSFFNTYDMKLAAGRFFSHDIPSDTTQSVVVNEAAVRTFGWQKPENAIGKRFGKGKDTRYVIGVVKDFNFETLHKPVDALVITYQKQGSTLGIRLNTNHLTEAIDHIKKTWARMVPDVPLEYSFIDDRIVKQYGNENKLEGIFYGFSGLSLLIACLGLFGLTTFVVERKVKEIGIRKVLGASVTGIVGLLSTDFMRLVGIAILIASPIAWYFMNRWLEDFAYRITIQWWVFALAGIAALLIALFTVSIQAIRAALANPVKSLKNE